METDVDKKEWIIKRLIDPATDTYEDWQGYCETLLSQYEMIQALHECKRIWPNTMFRGHNIVNPKCPAFRLEIL